MVESLVKEWVSQEQPLHYSGSSPERTHRLNSVTATALRTRRTLARRGAYVEALARLADAEKLAPRLALVCQYESNVAYLAGDRPRAIRALDRCLALEPDNALFRTNLDRLRTQR